MLSHDLAKLYMVEPKALMQAVKRNLDRFPLDFMFQLTFQEVTNLKSQFVTSSWGGLRKPPHAFTEQGIAMLSSVLSSQRAIQVNIEIMRTFVNFRKFISSYKDLLEKLDRLERQYNQKFRIVFQAIREIVNPPVPPRRRIGIHTSEKE